MESKYLLQQWDREQKGKQGEKSKKELVINIVLVLS